MTTADITNQCKRLGISPAQSAKAFNGQNLGRDSVASVGLVDTLTIELPWPVSDNALKTTVVIKGQGRTLLGAKARDYYASISSMLMAKRVPRMSGRLRVDVVLHPPDRRVIDPANRLKAIMDSLKRRHLGRAVKGKARTYDPKQMAWVFAEDDSQAVQGSWELRGIIPDGKVIVTLTKLPGEVQEELFPDQYPESEAI